MVFQDVVPSTREHEHRRRRISAKVEIGCNDFQGADLPRRLLHCSDSQSETVGLFSQVQRLDRSQAPPAFLSQTKKPCAVTLPTVIGATRLLNSRIKNNWGAPLLAFEKWAPRVPIPWAFTRQVAESSSSKLPNR
jgi:hypothetical protein